MHHKYSFIALILTLFILMTACLSTATPTAIPTAVPTSTVDAQATQAAALAAQATLDAQSTARVTATEGALAAQKTATQAALDAGQTATAQAKQTQAAITQTAIQSATAGAVEQATQQAQPLLDRMTKLKKDGMLTSTEGEYFQLEDYEQSWAQIDYYKWAKTGRAPANFVIRADIEWDSASNIANWFSSGCGFVFREDGQENHYMIFLGLDGYAYMMRVVGGIPTYMGEGFYGKLDVPSGKAQIMLAVQKEWINFFVNDKRVFSRQDFGLNEGNLAYTLVSGTNKGFGTYCHFTNVELWELK